LSRKHNGCMPPGQVRYYSVGQRLAPAVIYHTVPAAIVVTLGVRCHSGPRRHVIF
jgi:hypothetical protein